MLHVPGYKQLIRDLQTYTVNVFGMVFITETVMAQFPNFVQIKPINALLYTLVLCTAPHPLLSLLYFHLAAYIYQISTRKVPHVARDDKDQLVTMGASINSKRNKCIFFFLYPPTDLSTHPLSKENDLR